MMDPLAYLLLTDIHHDHVIIHMIYLVVIVISQNRLQIHIDRYVYEGYIILYYRRFVYICLRESYIKKIHGQ